MHPRHRADPCREPEPFPATEHLAFPSPVAPIAAQQRGRSDRVVLIHTESGHLVQCLSMVRIDIQGRLPGAHRGIGPAGMAPAQTDQQVVFGFKFLLVKPSVSRSRPAWRPRRADALARRRRAPWSPPTNLTRFSARSSAVTQSPWRYAAVPDATGLLRGAPGPPPRTQAMTAGPARTRAVRFVVSCRRGVDTMFLYSTGLDTSQGLYSARG